MVWLSIPVATSFNESPIIKLGIPHANVNVATNALGTPARVLLREIARSA